MRPTATPKATIDLPETLRYRVKNVLLGPPIASDRQSSERLGKPTALAVLSSDVISSSAYATEQMLIPLVIAIGAAAYSLVIPVTIAVIFVLLFVTLSYLEVVKVYTKAGGAYVVTRENFGLTVAQIAAMSLLIDYTLTVAVSVAAGVAAITSVFPGLTPDTKEIAIGLVIILAYGNLRGIREAGRVFAVPTYFFIANMVALMAVGLYRAVDGGLHAHAITGQGTAANPTVHIGGSGSGLLYGATIFVVLRAFASGGSALTGTEAISNGVSIFRRPESRNARITMILMAVILGSLVLGVSLLASVTHPVPYESGTPTVISQIAKFVYGSSGLGNVFYGMLQVGTTLILILAANTSFTGFPFLASFAAEDSYLPRQLTKRGHRLVFSTGIIVLTVVSIILLWLTNAKVDKLIPLYAIGVFTGFTMAGAGMAKYHWTHRGEEDHWQRRLGINGTASVLSFIVLIIIAVSKFTEGAWVILIILPLGVLGLLALHRQYADEDRQLEVGAAEAAEAPVLNRHTVIVLVDRLDMATARALQYARTLHPDDLRAVHFTLDNRVSVELEAEWSRLGLARLPLDVEECEDRRLTRATLEMAAETVADGQTELTILLPRRGFAGGWHRLLHDGTADDIAAAVAQLAHVNATVVPYQLTGGWLSRRREWRRPVAVMPDPTEGAVKVGPRGAAKAAAKEAERETARAAFDRAAFGDRGVGTTPISEAQWRHRVRVAGRVKSVRVQPRAGTSNLECVLADDTGRLLLVFQGRRRIPGIQPGARLVVEGMVGDWARRQAILNPDYELIAGPEADVEPT
jgi:amino acid transporter